MNPALDNEHQPFAPGYTAEDAKAILSGDIDDNMLGYGPPTAMPVVYHHQQPAYHQPYSFRPREPLQIFSPAAPAPALKLDTEYSTSIMPIETRLVDARQFSPVSTEEVWNTPFDPSSPSTIDTEDNSPITPAYNHHSSFYEHYAAKHGHPSASMYPVDAHAAHSQSLAQSNFGSFSSESSFSSYSGSTYGAPSFAQGHDRAEQLQGLAINISSAYGALAASTMTNPTFDSHAMKTDLETLAGSDTDEDATSIASSRSSIEPDVRTDRDTLLLDMRKLGYSYREIKRRCKFREAESTLRGRMRVLTKEKHERIRKPLWRAKDVDLLRRAVSKCTDGSAAGSSKKANAKMPWLKISRCIQADGASYPFAPATCAKKWMEIGRK